MRLLCVTVLLLIAGCSAPSVGSPPIESLPPTTDDCLTDAVPWPEKSGTVSGRQYPDAPETLTRESIKTFTIGFEKSYTHNDILVVENGTHLEEFGAQIHEARVSVKEGGYVVRLETWEVITFEDGTVAEQFDRNVGYFLSDTRIVRYELDRFDEQLDPDGGDVVVHCP